MQIDIKFVQNNKEDHKEAQMRTIPYLDHFSTSAMYQILKRAGKYKTRKNKNQK